jgi:hypothetical protein
MNLLYRQFAIDEQGKYVEVFVSSKKSDIVIRMVTEGNNGAKNQRTWLMITPTDLQTIVLLKRGILYFLTESDPKPYEEKISDTENGEIRVTGKIFKDEPFIHFRYFHKSANNEEFIGTRFGCLLNAQECIQFFRELENISSYIQYVLRYSPSVHILFDMIVNLIYEESVMRYEQNMRLSKTNSTSSSAFKTYAMKNYHAFNACVVPSLLSDLFLSYCRDHEITCNLSSKEVCDFISNTIVEDRQQIVYEVANRYAKVILKSMLGET